MWHFDISIHDSRGEWALMEWDGVPRVGEYIEYDANDYRKIKKVVWTKEIRYEAVLDNTHAFQKIIVYV